MHDSSLGTLATTDYREVSGECDRVVIDTARQVLQSHPLHRQSRILKRDFGLEISRATPAAWVARHS
jgi:hypothetical protein